MKLDTKIVCDICKGEFNITRGSLREEKVTLTKDNEWLDGTLTLLQCPACGKVYPVLLDNSVSLELLNKVRAVYFKRAKYIGKGKSVPTNLDKRYNTLKQKLDFKRRQLAEKFDGATYQLDGNTLQLDYRYRTR